MSQCRSSRFAPAKPAGGRGLRALAGTAALTVGLTASWVLLGPVRVATADEHHVQLQRTILDPRITESSGLARSGYDDGVLWTHNDSGDSARLYAVGRDGRTAATVDLAGVEALDWEAMSRYRGRGGQSWLFVGDIGDNVRARPEVAVHVVAEPRELDDVTVVAASYRLRYADGPRDAEALLVHPRTGELFVVSKEYGGGGVYAVPGGLRPDRVNVLERVANAPGVVTDGAILWDGRMALRTYSSVHVSDGPGTPSQSIGLPATSQGESLAVAPGYQAVLVGSEGLRSPVYRQPLPR